ncbi:hypothetical protein D3OALGB2SA_541 [Olavius algarvensis associated proteobacterium Delta 3]|nr:hypothetical protein D3OALGB2SA_541 [Olavius algarvensis associated proteobacterium Delta 3]
MIETNNLLIRKFRIDDLPDIHHFLSDPATMAYSGFEPFSIEQSSEWLLNHVTTYPEVAPLGIFAVVEARANRVIGYCGLEKLPPDIANEIEVTVGLAPEFWGKGYGAESVSSLLEYAFNKCRLDRIVSVVHAENQSAQNLFRSCRFQLHRELAIEGVGPHILFVLEPIDQETGK